MPTRRLPRCGDVTVPVLAGAETSVAATKSFIATLVALTHLAAAWAEDDGAARRARAGSGDVLRAAQRADWSAALPALSHAESLLVLGRGYTLPIAGEAALKFKETAGVHAEAFSIAEVAHGPMTLVGEGDPVLVFGPRRRGARGAARAGGRFHRARGEGIRGGRSGRPCRCGGNIAERGRAAPGAPCHRVHPEFLRAGRGGVARARP